jgi:hypothetical protein
LTRPHPGRRSVRPPFGQALRLAPGERLRQAGAIHAGTPALREHLALLFLRVVIDACAEHLGLGVVDLVLERHRPDLRDQILDSGVLDLGLVEPVALDLGCARRA